MRTSWFQQVLEQNIIAHLESLTGGRVEIAQFRFKPWLLQVTVQGIVIHGTESPGQPEVVSVRLMEAAVNPAGLLRRQLRLRYLDVEGLAMHLRSGPEGATNLPVPQRQTSPQAGLTALMDLSIGRLSLSHSEFFWNDQREAIELNARELALLVHSGGGVYGGTVSSSAINIRAPGFTVPPLAFNGRFELSPSRLTVTSLAWQSQGASGGAAFMVLPRPVLHASGSFHVDADLAGLAGILHRTELRAGTLRIEGLGTFEVGNVSARGRAQIHQMAFAKPGAPVVVMDGTTNYVLEKQALDLTGLVASFWGGTVQGSLHADLRQSPVTFGLQAQLAHLRLDNALHASSAAPLLVDKLHPATAADGALKATWSGAGENLHAAFDLALHAPAQAPAGSLPVSGNAHGSLEIGRGITLHLADSDFHTPHSTLTARGTAAENPSPAAMADPLAITLLNDNFEEWRPFFQAMIDTPSGIPLQLMSQAEFSGRVSGSMRLPSIAGRLNMNRFRYQGWIWDGLTASITLNHNFLQISDGRVEHGESLFEMNGTAQLNDWRLTSNSLVHASAGAKQTPIEGLRAAINVDEPIQGLLTGRLEVQGPIQNLAGSGSLRIDDGALAGEPFNLLSAQLQVTQSIWKLKNIQLVKTSGRMTGELTVEPQRQFVSGHLVGSRFRLGDIHRLPIIASLASPKGRLDGNLNFEAGGQGTAQNFHLKGSWQLRDLSLAGTALGEFDGSLAGEGDVLNLQGEDRSPGGQKLRLSASAIAKGDWPMQADGEYSGIRADPWVRAFVNRGFAAFVALDGSFHAQGPLRNPLQTEIQSRVNTVSVDFPSVRWRNDQPINVRYSGGRVTLDRFVMRGPSTELEIAGAVETGNGVTLALSADGSANATVLTLFDPAIKATGQSALHLRLTGTPARPLLNGTVNVQDVNAEFPGLPLHFSGLGGVIGLEGERAVIRSLKGTSGGGTVDISGFATLAQNPRFDLNAELSQVRLAYPISFTSVIDGRLRLVGTTERAEVQGDMLVRQMIVGQNVNIIGKIIESSNPMAEGPAAVSSPLASKIRLNVRVTSVPPVQVQTPNFRLVSDIDVRMQGSLANPVQVGSVHFLSGETVFRGNRFTLVRGDINLTNPFRTQAYLDLEAQTRVQSYDLTLDITGPFDRLKFAYRSDPPLTQTDIVSLLALGYVPQEQGQAFPTLQGNPATSIGASAILSEALSSQIGGRIQRLFGVSRIKIDPYVGMPGLGSGERVTVEQQITHELTLTYITDTSYSQYTIVQFELNLTNNLSVLGVRDPNGVFGIEFRFRNRFK